LEGLVVHIGQRNKQTNKGRKREKETNKQAKKEKRKTDWM
jgi:hypothetical protein